MEGFVNNRALSI